MKVQSDIIDTQALIGASQITTGGVGQVAADGHSSGAAAALEALSAATLGRAPTPALDPAEALLQQDVWQGEAANRSLAGYASGMPAAGSSPETLLSYVLEPLR